MSRQRESDSYLDCDQIATMMNRIPSLAVIAIIG